VRYSAGVVALLREFHPVRGVCSGKISFKTRGVSFNNVARWRAFQRRARRLCAGCRRQNLSLRILLTRSANRHYLRP